MKSRKVSILKGIGIFMVVYGHALFSFAYPLIQALNVTIFFLVAGWTYSYKKYANNVAGLIGARLHKFMIPYIAYMTGYLILHNTFYRWGLYMGGDILYTDLSLYINAFVGYFQLGFDSLCGPIWFMAPYLISVALWGNLISLVNRQYQKECVRLWGVIVIIACCFGILGVVIIQNGIVTGYRWEVAFLMLPVIALGKIISMHYENLQKFLHPVFALIALGGVFWSKHLWGRNISIASAELVNPYAFYFIELCAIYFVLWLVKIICQCCESNVAARFFCYLGDRSLDIMITHLTFFKLLYVLYIRFTAEATLDYVSFVGHYSILCLVVGIGGPLVIRKGAGLIYNQIKLKTKKTVHNNK